MKRQLKYDRIRIAADAQKRLNAAQRDMDAAAKALGEALLDEVADARRRVPEVEMPPCMDV